MTFGIKPRLIDHMNAHSTRQIQFMVPHRTFESLPSQSAPISHNVYIGTFNIECDVNRDGKLDILDLASVASVFGASPFSPRWQPAADANGDGTIDITDLATVAVNFGHSY